MSVPADRHSRPFDRSRLIYNLLPQRKYTNTSSFEAATFSVEIINPVATEKDCVSGRPTRPSSAEMGR